MAPQTGPVTTRTHQGTWGKVLLLLGIVGAHQNTETAPSGTTALNGADEADGADGADRSTAADPHANIPHTRTTRENSTKN